MTAENSKILIVDDDAFIRTVIAEILDTTDFLIETAEDGQHALSILKADSNFSLIISDMNMPGMSGLEVLEKIKSVNSNIPVVMITKSEEENIMDEAIGGQIDDYLIKPVNPKQVLLTIKKNLDNKRLITEKTTSSAPIAANFTASQMDFKTSLIFSSGNPSMK